MTFYTAFIFAAFFALFFALTSAFLGLTFIAIKWLINKFSIIAIIEKGINFLFSKRIRDDYFDYDKSGLFKKLITVKITIFFCKYILAPMILLVLVYYVASTAIIYYETLYGSFGFANSDLLVVNDFKLITMGYFELISAFQDNNFGLKLYFIIIATLGVPFGYSYMFYKAITKVFEKGAKVCWIYLMEFIFGSAMLIFIAIYGVQITLLPFKKTMEIATIESEKIIHKYMDNGTTVKRIYTSDNYDYYIYPYIARSCQVKRGETPFSEMAVSEFSDEHVRNNCYNFDSDFKENICSELKAIKQSSLIIMSEKYFTAKGHYCSDEKR